MGTGFKHGGSVSSLNFKVVGGTSEPANPKENIIWVNTETEITGYVFSATEPTEPVEGMVWISTGAISAMAFNALKKNVVQVYPMAASQYISGAWVSKAIQIYQDSGWKTAQNHLSLSAQNWAKMPNITYTYSLDYTDGILTFKGSKGVTDYGVTAGTYYSQAVDLTNYSELKLTGTWTKNGSSNFGIGVTNDLTITDISKAAAYLQWTEASYTGEKVLDVSALSGEYYLVMTLGIGDGVTCTAKISDILFAA